ncbi:class I SAM-dependent methyltransferase, partial [bacterium]|nr:class I SAM-dependent methyltransferase [bacterium]
FHIEPMQSLTWPDQCFDRVFSISVLEHIQPAADQKNAVEQMARVLKPGGLMLLTLDYAERPIPGKSDVFLPADVKRVIEWSGLSPVETPVFDVGNWDAYLAQLAEVYGMSICGYSAFTLVLKKSGEKT